jgi:hypothetical protein
MMRSDNMKKTAVIAETKHSCEFCNREFVRERTLLSHICEQKQRWLNRDIKGNRLGFQSWLQFYAKNSMSRNKNKTYEEFIKSAYYTSFVKFGNYCGEVNVVNVSRYVDWLLKENIKLDNWSTDSNYTTFLQEYLRKEDPFDAIHRGIEHTIELAKDANIQPRDLLRYGNANKICYAITTGKISPWMLYQSESGTRFLDTLTSDHIKMIIDYINPEQWAIKFKRDTEVVKQIKELLNAGGY